VQGNALIERLFKLRGKSDDVAAGDAGRADDVHHDGVHHRGESANIVAGRDAGGGRGVRHMLAAAVATLVMGLYANYPIALAPGMSLNAYFTYTVCIGMHVPWPTALGAGVFFGRAVRAADGDACAGTDRERDSAGVEARNGGRNWDVHRVLWDCGARNWWWGNPATFVSLGISRILPCRWLAWGFC